MKKKYEVRVTYTVFDYYTVIAESEEEAMEQAKNIADGDSLNEFSLQDSRTSIEEVTEATAEEIAEAEAYDDEDSDESEEEEEEDPTLTEAEKRDTLCRLWDAAWQQAQSDPETYRVIVETNEEDPTAPANEFGRYYMVDGSESESSIEHAGQWVVTRVDTVTSPYEVHRPNWAGSHGYRDDQTQLACRCDNPNNVTRWARLMIDAGRVTDIYADCY